MNPIYLTIFSYLLAWILFNLLVVDYLQTLQIALNPDKWFERNPLLGRHPSVRRVQVHFGITGLVCLAILIFAPTDYVIGIFGVGCMLEAVCIWNNNKIGIPT